MTWPFLPQSLIEEPTTPKEVAPAEALTPNVSVSQLAESPPYEYVSR